MTLKELQDWIDTAKYVDNAEVDSDRSGNEWASRVYQKGDELFIVEFLNGHPLEDSSLVDGKIFRDYGKPIKVERKTRMIEEIYYEEA